MTSDFKIQGPENGEIRLLGTLTAKINPGIWDFLPKISQGQTVNFNIEGLTGLDLNGASQLFWAIEAAKTKGAKVTWTQCPQELNPIWQLAQETLSRPLTSVKKSTPNLIEETGLVMNFLYHDFTAIFIFLGELITFGASLLRRPWTGRWGLILKITETAVVNSMPVTCLVAFLVGLILAFQSAMFMRMFGVEIFVADLVGIAMIRELGTLMTAIVLTGRTGSAFSAELGAMKTNQEIDAFLTMGLNPVRDLALPRTVAMTLATPLLTIIANLAGLIGGNLVMISLGFPVRVFWDELGQHINFSDIATGLFKAFVFGFTVAAIGCQRGLAAGSGPEAVGESTTRGVVTNIITIAFLDSLFAVLFYVLQW
jgi:phospholipid/cholesterol/gamma-HCH transport system permease protein